MDQTTNTKRTKTTLIYIVPLVKKWFTYFKVTVKPCLYPEGVLFFPSVQDNSHSCLKIHTRRRKWFTKVSKQIGIFTATTRIYTSKLNGTYVHYNMAYFNIKFHGMFTLKSSLHSFW